jgi:hypothetical protein
LWGEKQLSLFLLVDPATLAGCDLLSAANPREKWPFQKTECFKPPRNAQNATSRCLETPCFKGSLRFESDASGRSYPPSPSQAGLFFRAVAIVRVESPSRGRLVADSCVLGRSRRRSPYTALSERSDSLLTSRDVPGSRRCDERRQPLLLAGFWCSICLYASYRPYFQLIPSRGPVRRLSLAMSTGSVSHFDAVRNNR